MNIKAIKTLPGYCERRTGDRSSSFSGLVSGIPASPRLPSSPRLRRTRRRASCRLALALRSARAKEGLSSGVCLQSAFTLIELLITIVLVGIVLLALVMSFHESLKSMERQKDLLSASLLSEELMNEIRSKQFSNTPNAGTNFRVFFNDVNDYTNLFDTPPKTIEGSNLPNCVGFTRRASVVNVSNVSDGASTTNSTDFKRITVVVSNAQMSISNVSVVSKYD